MRNFLTIAYLESKKMTNKKIIWGGILAASLFSIAIGVQGYFHPENFGLTHVKAFFASIGSLVVYYFSSRCLGEEFDLKTSTMIFTSKVSRAKLYFAKVTSMLFIAVLMAVLTTLITASIGYLYGESEDVIGIVKLFLIMAGVYLLYVFAVGSFALFVTTLTGSSIVTLFTVVVVFSFVPSFLGVIAAKSEVLKAVMGYIPFYTANSFVNYHSGGVPAVVGLAVGGIIFLLMSILIIRNKDLY